MKQQTTCAIEQTGQFDPTTTGFSRNALCACAVETRPKDLQHEDVSFQFAVRADYNDAGQKVGKVEDLIN